MVELDIDWTNFGKTRSQTIDNLRRYSAANLDPYTVELAQALCEARGYTFSQLGHRNLTKAFDSLPSHHYTASDFEVGYGQYSVVPEMLKSNSGFVLAGIVGSLSEYFSVDFVVEFFTHLTEDSKVPMAFRPLRHQWTRMIEVFYGVLTTSDLGFLLSNVENVLPPPAGATSDVKETVLVIDKLSQTVHQKQSAIQLPGSAETVYSIAVAQWLFDLKVVVVDNSSKVLYSSHVPPSVEEANIIVTWATADKPSSSQPATFAACYHTQSRELISPSITGGRVPFEKLFFFCFGSTFTNLKDDTLAACLCCASNLIQQTLSDAPAKSRLAFLSQTTGDPGLTGHGLRETMLAWFPELRRLSPRFDKYSKLGNEESKIKFEDSLKELEKHCRCPVCMQNPDAESNRYEICSVAVVEVIVNLGLYVARMIVTPKLFFKRAGVLSLYDRYQSSRAARRQGGAVDTPNPPDYFVSELTKRLPSSVEMLKTGYLLFANAHSIDDLNSRNDIMGVTRFGLAILLSSYKDMGKGRERSSGNVVSIVVSPGAFTLFGHEARLQVYHPGYTGWTFDEQWGKVEGAALGLTQIQKWDGEIILSSLVIKGSKEEKQAESDGWMFED